MHLTPMRYKEFTWPHNPEIYQVERRREVVAHKVPFGSCVLQDLGVSHRILRGEGTFAGKNAYETFRALERVFSQEGPGLLVHPVWPAANAYFVTLQLTQKPLPDYVRYQFAFWEERGDYGTELNVRRPEQTQGASSLNAGETANYTVRRGDTLWSIAGRFGVTLTELIAANPQIKNPNLIYPGEKVRIP